MATPKRSSPPSVIPLSVIEELFSQVYTFDFPQTVRLLQGIQPDKKLGATDNPRLDPVHFQANVDFSISSSDVKKLDPGSPPKLTVTFLGIAGIQGPLPEVFTEILIDRMKVKDYGFRDFLDIFNHRLITFWYTFYGKLYPGLHDAPLEETDIGASLMDLGGMRYHEQGKSLIPLGTLFWQRSGSGVGLQKAIDGYFNIPCRIQPYVGGWNRVDKSRQTQISKCFHELGHNTVLGNRSFDQGKGFKVILGPLTYTQFMNFLPPPETSIIDKESGYHHLKNLIAAYFDSPPEYKIELILERSDVPQTDLSGQYRLARNTWLNNRGNFPGHGNVVIQ
ncbi:MAG: type VI secretion system baseplate subunit TssG [Alphaproteobacteria bacterium]|nr:type VI secretion system baseplate subunit TssG [Alphaproteobacteria bacterium]